MKRSKFNTLKVFKSFFGNISLRKAFAKIMIVFLIVNCILVSIGIHNKAEAYVSSSTLKSWAESEGYNYVTTLPTHSTIKDTEVMSSFLIFNKGGKIYAGVRFDAPDPKYLDGHYQNLKETTIYNCIGISKGVRFTDSKAEVKVVDRASNGQPSEFYLLAEIYQEFIGKNTQLIASSDFRYEDQYGSSEQSIQRTEYFVVNPKWRNSTPIISISKPTENQYFSNETGYNNILIQGTVKEKDIGDAVSVKYTITNLENSTNLVGHENIEIFSLASSDGSQKPFNHNILVNNAIPEGKYKLTITATDAEGDRAQDIKTFTVDRTPPTLEINLSPTSDSIVVNCITSDSSGLAQSPYRFTIGDTASDWISTPSYTFSNLSPNKDYSIKVEVKDIAGNSKSVTRKVYTKPEVPSITITNPTSTTLDVIITDNNPNNTAYQIINTATGGYINSTGEETTTPSWVIPQGKTVTVRELKSSETYTYKIKAKNEEGVETVFSSPVSGTTLNPPPEKVSEVTATATSNEITIYWNPVDNATTYEVEADGNITNNGINVSFIHIELLPDTEHTYRVRAINGEVEGEWSEAITKSTLPLAPVIPTNINTLSTENTITLTWNAVGNAVSYDIEVDGEVISNGNSTNYVHTGLLPNTTHSYRIRSINPAGKSEWSSEVIAKTITDSLPIPMNIVANSGKTSVEIRWNEIVGMEYQIEADGNIIDNGFNCIYIHSGLTPDTEHTYRVRSHKSGSYSDWSSPIMVRTSKDIFTAPSNIKSSATDTSIMISWEEVTGADGYDVEADGVIVDNGLNVSFTHEGLMPNTSHIYRIRARQGDTVSDWSSAINIVNISTYALATPKNLRATATETEIVVNWDIVTDADRYVIKINNDLIENITDTTYTISGLVPGTQKKIMVRAVNANGTSAYTVPITVITKASSSDSPQNISALTTKNQITLMWEPIQGAVSYDIEANGAVTSAVAANSYTFAELQPNITYTYKIRVNKADETQGQWSKAVTVTTMADAPDAPLNLTASSTLNSVRLSWDGAVGAVEYEVEAGGQILNAGASNNYLITGLTPNTEYSYKVRAKNPTTVGSWSQPITIKTKSSIQNYNINGNIGEEKNLVLNAIDIRDFEKYTFTITYNPDEIEIVDIASQTARPDLSIGNIGGTDIEVIQNTPGTLQFKKISPLPIGQSYSGIINSIRLKFKVDKEAVITYTIQ